MKKILFITAALCCQIAVAQRFPVGAHKIYGSWPGERPPSHEYQLQRTFPLLQEGYFNFGTPYTVYLDNDNQRRELLDSAARHNIQIFLLDSLIYPAEIERFYFDASPNYFNTWQGDQQADPAAEVLDPRYDYEQTALKANAVGAYMVRDQRFPPELFRANANYRAFFRLKVSRPVPVDSLTPIAIIEVLNRSGHIYPDTLQSRDFRDDNTYYLFPINFNSTLAQQQPESPPAAPSMPLDQPLAVQQGHEPDLRVRWLDSRVELWLDNIRVDGAWRENVGEPDSLFSGAYNARITSFAQKFISYGALSRFYLRDEPTPFQYRAFNYINTRLKELSPSPATGKGFGHTAFPEAWVQPGTDPPDPYVRAAQVARPYELSVDIYRLTKNDPLPSGSNYAQYTQNTQLGNGGYYTGFQNAIERFNRARQNSIYAESGTWWYYPNVTRWPGVNGTRQPLLSELNAQVHLALVYGAKGIMYFNYWTAVRPDDAPQDTAIGLVDPALDPINANSPFSYNHEDLWNGVRTLNQRLAGAFGTTLMQSSWQDAFSRHQLRFPLNRFAFLAGGNLVEVSTGEAESETYIEVGYLRGNNTDYFYVVNRRTAPGDARNITLAFSNTQLWRITDVRSNNTWTLSPYGTFNDTFAPGDGKLYRITLATPAAPTLGSPVNGATSVPTSVTLSWNASNGASSYRLQVSTSPTFSSFVVNQPGLTGTSYPLGGLANSTTYYWRVNGANAAGEGDWSQVWSFTTAPPPSPPPAPTLASPANGATDISTSPTLTWSASSGATSYQLQVSTNSSFSTTVVNQSGITTTSYTVTGILNSTTYYWRVNATGPGGTSGWSPTWSFTTASPSVVLLSPPNGATNVSLPPTLTWQAWSADATYHLQVSMNTSFSPTVVDQYISYSTSYTVYGLAGTTLYYWRVNATSKSAGDSPWSSSWNFTTAAAPVCNPLVAPYWLYASWGLWWIQLNWGEGYAACGIAGYKIYRRDYCGTTWYIVAFVPSGSLVFADYPPQNWSCANLYVYRVTTVDTQSNESSPSPEATGRLYWPW